MSSSKAPISCASDGDPPQSERSGQALKKRVTSTSDTRVESSLATADAPISTKRNSNHSRRHLVYAIKLTTSIPRLEWVAFAASSAWALGRSLLRLGSREKPPPPGLSDEASPAWALGRSLPRLGSREKPPPPGLSDEALQERWEACKGMMASLIPWRCSDDFDLPVVNGEYCTRVWDGDGRVPVVPLADNRARARRHRRPPPDEVVAQVAEAIFQPGAVPGWSRVAP
ncbi:hypothetical protein EV714DRAFT_270206 [Schizophyllum commune]